MVSHENIDQLCRVYVEYVETVTYQVFKAQMGNGAIYPTLGNHACLTIGSLSINRSVI